ncbi:MAG: SDR family oxidoreductase [Planctomycetes bacterium]|nr:SDR family oxidoreductase [Planctomycetota bacterium]
MDSHELEGRVALVTGGAKGIGRAICVKLAEAGADVAINYLSSEQAAQETAELLEQAGRRVQLVKADVSSPEQVEQMVADVENTLGPVDLLVNNAGIFDYVSHNETTLEIWQKTFDVNCTSAYLVTWAVKNGMIERGFGRIVNVSSISALRPRPMGIAYSVSKAGMIALTKCFADAVAKDNIRVNAIAPGLIETDIIDGVDQQVLDGLVNETPVRRIGQPDEIGDVVVFLLSERSSFMTGQTLVASGGRVMLP